MVVYTFEQRWEVGLRSTYRRCRFWQKKIIFSDEAHCDLGGYVSKKNYRIWYNIDNIWRCFAPCFWRSRFDTVAVLFVSCRQARDNWRFKGQYSWSHWWIQLHTIDNVLKNWTDRVGYCMASRGSLLNEIIFHY